MRVLVVHPRFYVYGGAERVIVRLCEHLASRGVSTTVLTTEILDEIRRDLPDADIVVAPNRFEGRRGYLALPGQLAALGGALRRLVPEHDVVNLHNFPAETAAAAVRGTYVWLCNEPELELLTRSAQGWVRLACRPPLLADRLIVRARMKKVVVADEFNARRFRSIYGMDPEIVPYGIDVEFFSAGDRAAARARTALGDRFVVLHVGMVQATKNQLASVEAIREVRGAIPSVLLLLAGGSFDRGYRAQLDDYVARHDLSANVRFVGHVDRSALRDLFLSADVMLHPVREQGGWLSPFEALCAGLPVIASREMTAASILEASGAAVVTDAYADALRSVHQDPRRHAEMAARGRAWVAENLSWSRFGDGMLRTFEAALARS